MKVIELKTKHDEIFLYPISDIHIGDKGFTKNSEEKLKGYIDWVKQTPNAYIFLNGDILNCASRISASSPFEQNMTLQEQIEYAIKIFTPVKSRIIGAITGNHESRLENMFGYNPTGALCLALGIPYLGLSAIVKFSLGRKNRGKGRENESRQTYIGYFHHTSGGGGTIGGKLNRVDKMRSLLSNADFYVGSHNHLLGVVPTGCFLFDDKNNKIIFKKQVLVDSGGFLEWNGYPEQNMLPPVKIGSPCIRLDGKKKDIHCSV